MHTEHAAHLGVQATQTFNYPNTRTTMVKIKEHNVVTLDPVLFWAGGMYHPTREREVIEWDEEYELDLIDMEK